MKRFIVTAAACFAAVAPSPAGAAEPAAAYSTKTDFLCGSELPASCVFVTITVARTAVGTQIHCQAFAPRATRTTVLCDIADQPRISQVATGSSSSITIVNTQRLPVSAAATSACAVGIGEWVTASQTYTVGIGICESGTAVG